MSDGLDTLFPATMLVQVSGDSVAVAPMTLGQIAAFSRAMAGVELPESVTAQGLLKLVGEHGDKVIEAIAIASKLDVAVVRDARLDESVSLLAAVAEVNADFLARAVERLTGMLPKAPPVDGAG